MVIDAIYIIRNSLLDSDWHVENTEKLKQYLRPINAPIFAIDGIAGRVAEVNGRTIPRRGAPHLGFGHTACNLSHFLCWKHFRAHFPRADNANWCLFFENDAVPLIPIKELEKRLMVHPMNRPVLYLYATSAGWYDESYNLVPSRMNYGPPMPMRQSWVYNLWPEDQILSSGFYDWRELPYPITTCALAMTNKVVRSLSFAVHQPMDRMLYSQLERKHIQWAVLVNAFAHDSHGSTTVIDSGQSLRGRYSW